MLCIIQIIRCFLKNRIIQIIRIIRIIRINVLFQLCFVDRSQVQRFGGVPVKVGNGDTIWSEGRTNLSLRLGPRTVNHSVLVLDTNAFEAVLGMDFLQQENVDGVLFHPGRLIVGGCEVPLREISDDRLNVVLRFKTESYTLHPEIRKKILKERFNVDEPFIDLFASNINKQSPFFCTRNDSAFSY